MSLEQIVQGLGLPGLLILVWYLLEIKKGQRAEKADEARNKIEERKTDALVVGFQSLNTKLDTHQNDETNHHIKNREAIVAMHTALADHLDFTPPPHPGPPIPVRRNTPAQGTEYAYRRPDTKGK